MNDTIVKVGGYLGGRIGKHPDQVRRILELIYRGVSFQAGHFPSKAYLPSRESGQAVSARNMASVLAHSEKTAVVNIFMSCEIFHALGIPVSAPEALSIYLTNTAIEQVFLENAEENGASSNFCSFHRCLMGLCGTGVLRKPLLIANTTLACDANRLSFRYLEETWKVPHFVVDVPFDVGEESVLYVAEQLRELGHLAEDCAHRKLDPDQLKEAVARSIRSQNLFRRYLSLRGEVHLPELMSPELMNVINNHICLGLPEAEDYMTKLLADVSAAPKLKESVPRVLWMHVLPNAQESLKAIFQGADNDRIEVLGCDLAYDCLVQMDAEKPYESMARRIVEASYNGAGSRRIQRTLDLAEKMKADGIVIFCQWGCKQTQGIAFAAKRIFEEHGLPTLVLDGDAADRANEASGQSSTRASAFVEALNERKSGRVPA